LILKQKGLEKKHSLCSKRFRLKLGRAQKTFYATKKQKKCFKPAKNPTETLVTKAKKPKKHVVERITGWYG